MRYQRIPYALRYLVALVTWAALLALVLMFKFFLIPCIPIIFMLAGFGTRQTQETAQMNANLIDLFVYGWPKFPRCDWRRLLGGGRRHAADHSPETGFIQDAGHNRA